MTTCFLKHRLQTKRTPGYFSVCDLSFDLLSLQKKVLMCGRCRARFVTHLQTASDSFPGGTPKHHLHTRLRALLLLVICQPVIRIVYTLSSKGDKGGIKKKKKTRNRLPLTARHCRGYPTRMLVHFPDHPTGMLLLLTAGQIEVIQYGCRDLSPRGTIEVIQHQAPLRLFDTRHH